MALGLADSDDEDIEQDIDEKIETLLAPKRTVKEVSAAPVPNLMSLTPMIPGLNAGPGILGAAPSQIPQDKLEMAKRAAAMIMIKNQPQAPPTGMLTENAAILSNAILTGSALPTGMTQSAPLSAKSIAEQMAARLNTKLNYQPPVETHDDQDDEAPMLQAQTFQKYEEELEINDFPQQVRWKITSKEALAQISEYSEAGITVRGLYTATGKNPDNECKLYLAIESQNELAVSKAKQEIMRLIKEELIRLQTAGGGSQQMMKNRYRVV